MEATQKQTKNEHASNQYKNHEHAPLAKIDMHVTVPWNVGMLKAIAVTGLAIPTKNGPPVNGFEMNL